MTNLASSDANGSASILQTTTTNAPTPTWRPPKAPLPPHRLAKLANALGVATPVPVSRSFTSPSRTWSDSLGSGEDAYRRSPTPSTAASTIFSSISPTASKFFLHVLPPSHFPYDPENPDDNDLLPPPSSASGYHTQFRRGILVPLYSSFQSQLAAIAKEYALPSATGLILYLITSPSSSKSPTSYEEVAQDEPGPRLSEDIWRHIWMRVIQAEREDNMTPSTRSNSPNLVGLRMGMASRSTPQLLDTAMSPLRPLISTPTTDNHLQSANWGTGLTTSPSTPSSTSDLRSNSKSGAASSVSTQDEPETPDTSAASNTSPDPQASQSFDLPGLRSPSLIPILAKVEFDIDRRKAGWYEPWLKSRRANRAKRAESRLGRKFSSNQEGAPADGQERQPPIQLIIGREQTASSLTSLPVHSAEYQDDKGSGYERLPESDGEDGVVGEVRYDAKTTTQGYSAKEGDPLADVFGTDADTWADIHGENRAKRLSNPNVVDLALTADDLNDLPDEAEDPGISTQTEEEEVKDLLNRMPRPALTANTNDAPPSPPSIRSSTSTVHTTKKHIPSPLVLIPKDGTKDLVVPAEPSPMPSSAGSEYLPYLKGSPPGDSSDKSRVHAELEDTDDRYTRVRTPAETEKRAGTFYDDLDLGLDPTEDFDDDDPNDHRRSQFLLKVQLDEIERTMAQLSPRMLRSELGEDSGVVSSSNLPPMTPNSIPLSPGAVIKGPHPSPSHGVQRLVNNMSASQTDLVQGPPRTSSSTNQVWPAISFASIRETSGPAESATDELPSPPQLALNGVTTSAPKSFFPVLKTSNEVSPETKRRKRELEDEYPALAKSSVASDSAIDASVIPLSPDPFGRYPSTPDLVSDSRLSKSSTNEWDTVTIGRGSTSLEHVVENEQMPPIQRERSQTVTASRFSVDSITEEDAFSVKPSMKSTLMTVKSIRKLWRKSNHKNNSHSTSSTNSSGHVSSAPPTRPERPVQETMDLPDVDPALPTPPPSFKSYSPQSRPSLTLPSGRTSQDLYRPRSSQDQSNPPRTSYDQGNGMGGQNLNVPQSKQNLPTPQNSHHGLNVPTTHSGLKIPSQNPGLINSPLVGRSLNHSPIAATRMLPGRGGLALDNFHFDQESPYPVHVPPSPRYSPRPASPPLPVVPAKEKPATRKSILKAFQRSTTPSPPESRPSTERQGWSGQRTPSFHSSRSSTSTPVHEIPPSPRIPEQFINANGHSDSRESEQSERLSSSIDTPQPQMQHAGRPASPTRSMASSRDSRETRPSFDTSQFEIVSPKSASTLTYPYHGLDHQ